MTNDGPRSKGSIASAGVDLEAAALKLDVYVPPIELDENGRAKSVLTAKTNVLHVVDHSHKTFGLKFHRHPPLDMITEIEAGGWTRSDNQKLLWEKPWKSKELDPAEHKAFRIYAKTLDQRLGAGHVR